jgi:hypothetical protein
VIRGSITARFTTVEVMSVGGDSPPASDELADPIVGEASGGGAVVFKRNASMLVA